MIRNIVFDMGQVLIRFDRQHFLQRLELDSEERELLSREVFLSIEWAQLDRGLITEQEATQIICKRVPERLHAAVDRLINSWDEPITPIEGMKELLQDLYDKRYELYLLSNASSRQHEYWSRIPGSELFRDTLISADVRVVKPQPEIYQMACQKFGIHPEESVFIDDSPANVETACYLGWKGIVFHGDIDELKQKLGKILNERLR